MKRFLVTLLSIFCLTLCAYADDTDLPATGDLWDNFGTSQDFYGQDKSVSDEDFDKALENLKDKKNKWIKRFKKMQTPKGEEFHQGNETEIINQNEPKDEGLPVICIPIELIIGEHYLPVGHYQVEAKKDEDGNVTMNFYQSKNLMAQVNAVETNEDFEQDLITFAKWVNEDEDSIKIIFGSLDINAYTIIKFR